MAELVYAFDLKSNGEIHMGSSPISGTKSKLNPLSNRRIFTPKILAIDNTYYLCYNKQVSTVLTTTLLEESTHKGGTL